MDKKQLLDGVKNLVCKSKTSMEINEYRDLLLGFVLYKHLSEREYDGYSISPRNLFSDWVKNTPKASDILDALISFDKSITLPDAFGGLFDSVKLILSKKQIRQEDIDDIIGFVNEIPDSGECDVLGHVYEGLMSGFGVNFGGLRVAGEFYTPREVTELIAEIVGMHARGDIRIYDPTSGSGGLLVAVLKKLRGNIHCYASELKAVTSNLAKSNLLIHGVSPHLISVRNTDILENDWPCDNIGNPLSVDAVVSNPPYSQAWTPKGCDPRFDSYGIAPKSKADFAFLLHGLYHLKDDGIMAIVLPHGVLFRGNSEKAIRKRLLENNLIDTIIGLPPDIFYGTSIPTVLIILKKSRKHNDILFIDASDGFERAGRNNRLRKRDVLKITDTIRRRSSCPKYSALVSVEEIAGSDWNLNIPRYVDKSNCEISDLYALVFGGIPDAEIDLLSQYWESFPMLRDGLFVSENGTYRRLAESFKEKIRERVEGTDFGFEDLLRDMRQCGFDMSRYAEILREHIARWSILDFYEQYEVMTNIAEKTENKEDFLSEMAIHLSGIPRSIALSVENAVLRLREKYENSFSDVFRRLRETERELCSMLDDLNGNSLDMQAMHGLKRVLMNDSL